MSTVAAPPRRGIPLWGPLAGRLVYRNVVVGRRAWLLVLSGFFEPVFFLLGIGLGVGALVGDVSYGASSCRTRSSSRRRCWPRPR